MCHGKGFRDIKNFKISVADREQKNTYVFVKDQFYSFPDGWSLCQLPVWQWEELWRWSSRLARQTNWINLLDDWSNMFKYYSIHSSKFSGQHCHSFYVHETVRLHIYKVSVTYCEKFLPASWEICMKVKEHQLELDMEQWTGCNLGKEYIKAVCCHLLV